MTKKIKSRKQEYDMIKKPSAALSSFVTECDLHAIEPLTKPRVTEALAADLVEDDIRMTDFNVRYREPNQRSPAGTLIVEHTDFNDSKGVIITSNKSNETHNGKKVPATLWSVITPQKADTPTVAEDKGCLIALQEASKKLKEKRDKRSSKTRDILRRLKHFSFN